MTQIPERYDPKTQETKWQQFWEENSIFQFNENDTTKPVFSIDTPPPTLSGAMHIGHAFSYSQQDFIARFHRQAGFNVYYPFGTDDNGLATEKLVQKERKVNLRKIPREEAIRICIEYLQEARPAFIQDWKNIGMSCDFNKCYSTINDYSRKISQKSFLDLAKKGLVYRKEGPVMWDRVFQTAIAQAELEDLKRNAFFNYLLAPIKEEPNTFVIFATTRPELLFACVGMSVQEDGEYFKIKVGDKIYICGKEAAQKFQGETIQTIKGKDLLNKTAIIPFTNKPITITHDQAIDAQLGTGIAYFCTFGGVEDIEWAARHKQEPISTINPDGTLNEKAGEYQGLLAELARKKIITDLEEAGHLILKEKKEQVVNVGERSGTEVEFIISNQWYVKYLDQKDNFLKASSTLQWHPEHMKHRLDNWIKGLNWDWGISRQRHFGIPIPVWYDQEGKIYFADESQLPIDPLKDRPLSAPKDIELTAETDVFDTWFTSSSTPYLATNLIENDKVRSRVFPMSLRPQSHDIINFWLFYSMAKTQLLEEKNPWKNAAISGWVLDPHGKKMSKSKGNVVSPQDVIEKFSSDAIRYAAAATKYGEDQPYQEKNIKTGIRFTNKLYNAAKFSFMHLENYTPSKSEDLETIDAWLLSKLQTTIEQATHHFQNYEYSFAKAKVEQFFWQLFCDQYLEIVKDRLYNPDQRAQQAVQSARFTLYTTLLALTKMMAPITPFITEEIYQLFFKETQKTSSIHVTAWPEPETSLQNESANQAGDLAIQIISAVRKYKSENKLSLKEEITTLTISAKGAKELLTPLLDDLKAVCKAKEILFVGQTPIEVSPDLKIGIVK